MSEFINFITKGIEFEKDGDRRIFSGHISAEVVDHQNDFIFVKEIIKVMETYMKVLPVLSEVHSNRMIGKVLGYEKSQIDGHDSVKITAEVFKQEGVTLYDQVWNKIKSGVYNGLSMGGGSKSREPMFKDGRYVMSLSDLELYEIAVCNSPANPLAIIDKYNTFAKSEDLSKKINKIDNRNIIQCSSISCEFGKGINDDIDIDLDNEKKQNIQDKLKPGEIPENRRGGLNIDMSKTDYELQEDTRRKNRNPEVPSPETKETEQNLSKQEVPQKKVDEKGLEQFDKPEIKKDHIPGIPEEIEEKARKKNESLEKGGNLNVTNDNQNLYKGLSETNINNMTQTTETKTDEIRKEDQTVKVDPMATVVSDLLKTKDELIKSRDSKIEELSKKIDELSKVVNKNPVDGGIEQAQGLKATDPDDVGTKADAQNDVAPKPSEAQADIIPPAVKEPGTDSASVTMENKSDYSEKKEDKKEDEMKKQEEEKEKEKEKKEEVKKTQSLYKVVETVRPIIKSRDSANKPTAYQMLKACEQGFGQTKNAADALVIMHQKMLKGEFGDGNPSGGIF